MNGYCKKCKSQFELTNEDYEKIETVLKPKGCTRLYRACPFCNDEVMIVFEKSVAVENFRCPVSQCAGWGENIE